MEVRDIFKKVVHFANWEYKEKRPKSVKVLRVKSKSLLTLGVLPELQMRTIGPIMYLVVSDNRDTLMIYFFNRNGERIGGQNYEPTPKFMKKLNKSTTVKYQLPKKERKERVDDTLLTQKEFSKMHQNISNILGIYHKYPYTVLVNKELQFELTRELGCKRIEKKLQIPLDLINKSHFEFLVTVEWFYSYLTSSIPLSEESVDTSIIYDLALLLSVVFNLNFLNKISSLKLASLKIRIQDKNFDLTEDLKLAIKSLSHVKSNEKLSQLLKKYCAGLKMLNRYRISLSLAEILELFIFSCEMFNTTTDAHMFYTEENEDIANYFYFKVFSRAHELSKELNMELLEYKTYLLSTLFGLHLLNPEEIMETPYSLTEVIENIGKLIENPIIYDGIQRIDELVSDIISEYILRYQKFNTVYEVQEDILDFTLEIENQSNFMLQDVKYELVWKPKNRIQRVNEEKEMVAHDLHKQEVKHFLFTIHSKGSISFSCKISFIDPIFQDKIKIKTIQLQKLILK